MCKGGRALNQCSDVNVVDTVPLLLPLPSSDDFTGGQKLKKGGGREGRRPSSLALPRG